MSILCYNRLKVLNLSHLYMNLGIFKSSTVNYLEIIISIYV